MGIHAISTSHSLDNAVRRNLSMQLSPVVGWVLSWNAGWCRVMQDAWPLAYSVWTAIISTRLSKIIIIAIDTWKWMDKAHIRTSSSRHGRGWVITHLQVAWWLNLLERYIAITLSTLIEFSFPVSVAAFMCHLSSPRTPLLFLEHEINACIVYQQISVQISSCRLSIELYHYYHYDSAIQKLNCGSVPHRSSPPSPR